MDEAILSSVWITAPEFAGWLTKRGFAWRKLWRQKWVALHGAEVVYMDNEPTPSAYNHGLKLTKAPLTASTKVDPEDLEGNPYGFAIHFNDGKSPVWYLRASSVREKKDWLMRLSHVMAIVNWLENFEKVRVLGLGGTGIVYELLHKSNGQRFALKEIEIKNKAQMQVALKEAEMLKEIMENISHPNIMHIEKVFQVGSKFYLVFPLCTGGELYEHVIRRGKFTERDAANLTRDLISAIHALHSRDILHLDIKPENILFQTPSADSLIKLADFGLSKFFSDLDQSESRVPSLAEMDARLKDFSDNGVLNTMKLKGTVGYMAPELILTGHTSKASDIFAAGVVLYILLCGHPPFHSKSNRDVLEKSARCVFRMDGSSWRDVSAEAKDLVAKMLSRDPQRRITAQDILVHPWLAVQEEPQEEEAAATAEAAEAGAGASPPFASKNSAHRNLTGLRLLSEHVAERRSEKFMSGLTNLVSFMHAGGGYGSKLVQFIRLADGQLLPNLHLDQDSSNMEDRFIFLNPYVKTALCGAIRTACDDGRLSVEQFLSVLKKLGITSGLPGMFLCRFIDRDGDGFISADDLFTTQALVMQRSEVFLRVVFRVYSESIWYPGRQLNLVNYYQQQSTPKKPSRASSGDGGGSIFGGGATAVAAAAAEGSSSRSNSSSGGGSRVLDEGTQRQDVVEPPKFITARHVAEVFGKLGYDQEDGKSVFTVLCEGLERLREQDRSPTRESDDGADDSHPSASAPPPLPLPLPLPLSSQQQQQQEEVSRQMPLAPRNAGENAMPPLPGSDHAPGAAAPLTPTRTPLTAASLSRSLSSAAKGMTLKMNVDDFIRCASFDDVLVQAIMRRPRSGFMALVNKAKAADLAAAAARTSAGAGAVGEEEGPSSLEEELVSALRAAKVSPEQTVPYPIASAVALGTLNVLSNAFSAAADIVGSFEGVRTMSKFTVPEEEDDEE
jgi:serine/threonine protein kinase